MSEKITKAETRVVCNIHTQLLEFQKQGISIKSTQSNKAFGNKYADINEVLEKVKPVLSELGVLILQVPDTDKLTTTLMHLESGTSIETVMEFIQKNDIQKLGGNITYFRRYSLVSMLGLEEDDDDGNVANTPAQAQANTPTKAPAPVPAKPTMTASQAFAQLRLATSVTELEATYKTLSPTLRKDTEVIAVAGEVKKHIINNEEPVIAV